ncbi:choline dehydrogenase-like flavoprotein [Herbaspirillum sp. Sphag1AN]|uniref:FAD-dependent oxidoreductase n=1 Tax=unclassified Herbaspirillum TaxID=2624150 RepID=UPI00180B755C|nr:MULTISPECIES: FAD-dependent oxidoreductase [unclassified Herbaspirillum]MBB3211100.1 choline dehydrogenase-like flavoprotein [Herbaspirillum sp. Sphag1AN]MBB3244729.1 choline dehydrogenase-like flavoprotein [Herbaspirillum sp. Sphag64]
MLAALPVDTQFDICVMGAGPVGLTLALEAAAQGLQVLVLEAGTQQPSPTSMADVQAEIADPKTHAPLALATNRAFGGNAWLWGGRCVPFEAIDFEARAYVPHSGWPLTLAEITPWYAKAAEYLDCGHAQFRDEAPSWSELHAGPVALSQLERWARQPKLAPRLGERALGHPHIHFLFDATVTGISLTQDGAAEGQVTALQVHHRPAQQQQPQQPPLMVQARHYVLAGGALEITRLLLLTQQRHPELPTLFGGAEGPLGRYYMGHIFGSIASIVLKQPQDFDDLDFTRDSSDTYVRRRFTLSELVQREQGLLNTSFFADNPPFYDARHRNPTLSLVFLALAIPAIGRRMLSEAIRLMHLGPPPHRYGAHILNVLRRPWAAATDVLTILRLRYLSSVRKPGFVLRNQGGTYALKYHAEQIPNPDSRVTLGSERDALGVPRLRIDFRYLPEDAQSVLKTHTVLDQALRASGKGTVDYHRAPEQRMQHVMEQATDGFHQIGLTRMHADPTLGVVDSHCRVHGIGNLYIASSSVFPTAGEANPTFLAAALAARLAAHLVQLGDAPADKTELPVKATA